MVSAQLQSKRWKTLILGGIVGLALSRLAAESVAGPWSLPALTLLWLASTAVGLGLSALLTRFIPVLWPLSLLLIYVLWPWPWPELAWAVLAVSLVVLWMLNAPRLPLEPWLGIAVFLAALALYISTLSPTVLPADSGEFQLVATMLGIAHPPGYPLYTMLGKLFALLPVGDPAYRLNLFAAVCGALTLAVMARSVHRATGSAAAALVAAGMLGLSTTYWVQSTTANIRSLTALLTALCITALLRWGEAQESHYLSAFALCFGLGWGHHSSIGLLGLPFLAYILACAPHILVQPRRWLPPLGVFLASTLVLLYLPLRSLAGAPFDPVPIRSWAGFLDHVLALGFRGDFLYFRTWPELSARIGVWLQIMRLEFGPILPLSALLAAYPLARSNRRGLLLLGGVWAVNTLAAITYRAPQTVEYLIPSYVALALLTGLGLGPILRRLTAHRSLAAALVALLMLGAAANGAAAYPSLRALHGNTSARDYAQAILSDAPAEALVLSNWHYATVFWYLQQVEGTRPDVEVRYVYPEGATPNEEVWLRRITEDIDKRPVVVTDHFYAYERTDYRWIPFHQAWLVRKAPLTTLPQQIAGQEAIFEEGIRVLGYQLDADSLTPGETLSVRIYWQPTARLQRDYSTFAQLIGPYGVVGQGDIAQRSREYLPGEIRVDAYRIPLLLHTAPGDYQLITGFYYSADGGWKRLRTEGSDHLPLATVQVHVATEPAATMHPQERHYANGLRLTGVDYDRTVPGQTRIYLHWQRSEGSTGILGSGQAAGNPAIVRLNHGEEVIAQAQVPALPPGGAATIALDVPDTTDQVTVSLSDADGRPLAGLGPWHWPIGGECILRLPQGEVHYVPLGGKMVFVGFRQPTEDVLRGTTLWLRPRFLATRPLLEDDSVSIGLVQHEPFWERKSDGTPALGAIPTLKWVRGWLVEDPHALAVPADAPAGPARVTLSVYDAFTLNPLGVLDERLVRQGQGTYIESGSILIRR